MHIMCYTCSWEVKTRWTIERKGHRSKLHCKEAMKRERERKKKEIAIGQVNIPSL